MSHHPLSPTKSTAAAPAASTRENLRHRRRPRHRQHRTGHRRNRAQARPRRRARLHEPRHDRSRARRGRHKIVIGKDTRLSGYMLENALAAGVMSLGVDVLSSGRCPRPASPTSPARCAPMPASCSPPRTIPTRTTASSFSAHDGYKLDDEIEKRDRAPRLQRRDRNDPPDRGQNRQAPCASTTRSGRYIEFAKASFPRGHDARRHAHRRGLRQRRGLQVHARASCANSARTSSSRTTRPNGRNINHDCGSTHPEEIQRIVQGDRARTSASATTATPTACCFATKPERSTRARRRP